MTPDLDDEGGASKNLRSAKDCQSWLTSLTARFEEFCGALWRTGNLDHAAAKTACWVRLPVFLGAAQERSVDGPSSVLAPPLVHSVRARIVFEYE